MLSVLIGVNDYWHFRNGKYKGTVEVYKNDYTRLIQETKEKIPGIKLVICQPFIVKGTSAVDSSWIQPFMEYQEGARLIAESFNAVWVPFQEVFDIAVEHASPAYWTPDGVHPSMAGCQLMAEAWLQAIQ